MKITSIPAREISPEHVYQWSRFQDASPELASPCFSPEMAQAIGAVRSDFRVGLLQERDEVVGFLPFFRDRHGVGSLPGLCDYQGLVGRLGLIWDAKAVLRGCGLVALDFDHLLASQSSFQPYHQHRSESPVMDLSGGYDAYAAGRRAAGSEQIKKAGNLQRRLEREVGPIRFATHVGDQKMLSQLICWADERYGRGTDGEPSWIFRVLEKVLTVQKESFGGMLSVLYAGEKAVAAHFGMRSRTAWHYWWPAFDPQFEKYSPGIVLLLQMAQAAPAMGIRVIDLGKGQQAYKQRLMSGSVTLAEGSVELPSLASAARALRRTMKTCLTRTPALATAARKGAKWLRQL